MTYTVERWIDFAMCGVVGELYAHVDVDYEPWEGGSCPRLAIVACNVAGVDILPALSKTYVSQLEASLKRELEQGVEA